MAPRRRRRTTPGQWALLLALAVLLPLATDAWLPVKLVLSALAASSVLGWWILFVRRTNCDVENKTDGQGCGNAVRGLVRACPLHRRQKADALWALFGLRNPGIRYRITFTRTRQEPALATPGHTANAPTPVPGNATPTVAKAWSDRLVLICTVVGTVATVIGLIVHW